MGWSNDSNTNMAAARAASVSLILSFIAAVLGSEGLLCASSEALQPGSLGVSVMRMVSYACVGFSFALSILLARQGAGEVAPVLIIGTLLATAPTKLVGEFLLLNRLEGVAFKDAMGGYLVWAVLNLPFMAVMVGLATGRLSRYFGSVGDP